MKPIKPDYALDEEQVVYLLENALLGNERMREDVISTLLEHCVAYPLMTEVKDAMRWAYWFWLEQLELGRTTGDEFSVKARAVFVRFCAGMPREMSEGDIKIVRLILANLYSVERDPFVLINVKI